MICKGQKPFPVTPSTLLDFVLLYFAADVVQAFLEFFGATFHPHKHVNVHILNQVKRRLREQINFGKQRTKRSSARVHFSETSVGNVVCTNCIDHSLAVWPALAEDLWKQPCTSNSARKVLRIKSDSSRHCPVQELRSRLDTWVFSMTVFHRQDLFSFGFRKISHEFLWLHFDPDLVLRHSLDETLFLALAAAKSPTAANRPFKVPGLLVQSKVGSLTWQKAWNGIDLTEQMFKFKLAHVFFTEESASLPQQVSGRPKGAKPDRSTVSPSAKSLSQVP